MKVIAEYIWIDALGDMRSKARVLEVLEEVNLGIFPEWCFDGSSTGMSYGKKSDIVLRAVAFFKDPFRRYMPAYLVLCDTYNMDNSPHCSNNRFECMQVCKKTTNQEPWFGIEQEYFLYQLDGTRGPKPYGWLNSSTPSYKFPTQEHPKVTSSAVCDTILASAPSYCGIGGDRIFGRQIVETHLEYCLYADVKICGINAEVVCSQFEFQIGICNAEEMGDHLWIARYILSRVAEEHGAYVEWSVKPVGTAFGGSGCHTNFSTKVIREDGLDAIVEACKKMESKEMIDLHLKSYGDESNKLRLVGHHETARFDQFSYGVADRGASVRIPYTSTGNKFYMEDRRPASNCDPYKVVTRMLKTICLNEK